MHKILLAIIGLFFLVPFSSKAQETVNGHLELSMNYPKVKRKIGFQYMGDLASSPDLKTILYYSVQGRIYAEQLSHAMIGSKAIGSFSLPDSAQAFAIVFKTTEQTDLNYDKGYIYNIYTENLPSLGTYASAAIFYGNMAGTLGLSRNYDKAIALYEKEFALHPDQEEIYKDEYISTGLYSKDRNAALDRLKRHWEQMLIRKAPEDSLIKDYTWLANFDRPNIQSYKDSLLALYPHGILSAREASAAIFKKATADDMVSTYQALIKEYPAIDPDKILNTQQLFYIIAKKYWDEKNADKFQDYADKVRLNNMRSSLYNSAAWPIAEAKLKDSLTLGVTLAKKSVEAAAKLKEDRPSYYTQADWDKVCASNYSMVADTYAYLLFQQGNIKEALDIQQKAIQGMNTDPDMNGRYIQYLLAADNNLTALEQASDFIKAGTAASNMKDMLSTAYQKVNNTDSGFATYYDNLNKAALEKKTVAIKATMTNQPSASFTLKDLNGNTITLDSLKGKVVILDFWATWCGPCKISFPGMQLAINKYKDDPEVVFLFIDTWERQPTMEQRKSEIQQFIKESGYNFQVLLDNPNKNDNSQYETVSAYGVNAIPTKFVLNKEGKIRFKATGFTGTTESLAEDLSIMIELAKQN